ncbi:MerR family transcriptional regulator [Roseateles sp. GG27B]
MEKALPSIPAKRYFTIGEVSELCGVKPYVLRYWEQEFTQLKPMKRRGNRRYYQHHEVLLIRRIRDLLYDQGFTISGARNQLVDGPAQRHDAAQQFDVGAEAVDESRGNGNENGFDHAADGAGLGGEQESGSPAVLNSAHVSPEKWSIEQVKAELISIRADLLV